MGCDWGSSDGNSARVSRAATRGSIQLPPRRRRPGCGRAKNDLSPAPTRYRISSPLRRFHHLSRGTQSNITNFTRPTKATNPPLCRSLTVLCRGRHHESCVLCEQTRAPAPCADRFVHRDQTEEIAPNLSLLVVVCGRVGGGRSSVVSAGDASGVAAACGSTSVYVLYAVQGGTAGGSGHGKSRPCSCTSRSRRAGRTRRHENTPLTCHDSLSH